MSSTFQQILNEYYRSLNIHPKNFNCQHQSTCRMYAHFGNMTETKMSMVGSQYGVMYPKIVVVSLDPPSGNDKNDKPKRWVFKTPNQRTTDYVSQTHEADDYSFDHCNVHWAMTQIIVKDVLSIWGYQAVPNAARVMDPSYEPLPIQNVSAYFAHVNVAKCSMNNPGQGQASIVVHRTCSSNYLLGELLILEPDILITQGAPTNKLLGKMLVGQEMPMSNLPTTKVITVGNRRVLWMPMYHPATNLKKIRDEWKIYLKAAKAWAKKIK